MVALSKVVLASCATAAVALTLTACDSSTTSSTASSAASVASSVASSIASSAVASATSAIAAAAAAPGSLASVCTQIDGVMLGSPDADPAGTAAKLEAIKANVTTPDADLLENLAAAYTAIAANPADAAAQAKLQASAKALGAGCEMATTAPRG